MGDLSAKMHLYTTVPIPGFYELQEPLQGPIGMEGKRLAVRELNADSKNPWHLVGEQVPVTGKGAGIVLAPTETYRDGATQGALSRVVENPGVLRVHPSTWDDNQPLKIVVDGQEINLGLPNDAELVKNPKHLGQIRATEDAKIRCAGSHDL